MQTVTVSWLKSLEAFNNVPEDQLQWLLDNSIDNFFEDGEFLMQPGEPMSGPHIMVEGGMRFFMMQGGSRREFTVVDSGNITGYLPFSRGKISKGYAQAVGKLHIRSFDTDLIPDMIRNHYELTQSLVNIMTTRVRDFTAMQQQNEKMMALGKLSAGLAHELNNPASAIVRDSLTLKKHLEQEPESVKAIFTMRLEPQQVTGVTDLLFQQISQQNATRLSLKQRTHREDEIIEWFDEHEIENGYDIVESFVDFNFSTDTLEKFNALVAPENLSDILNWISDVLISEKMISDIQESARRIAELVSSVKTFTHMDRGQDKQYADIHIGIRNTLTMLGYKIRKGNINVIEDFDESLPEVRALIGELNQVWTNLIDNAIDAMAVNGTGTLTVKTRRDREFVEVFIVDDGPGIPQEIQSLIFDPFFTTKEMGKGTGMGLEVVQRIVKQHRGSIKVKSEPGKTVFSVCFLIDG
ncbi:Histidine kinase-, DNA gyrase B-, and HSP90-like ATPase [Mucilaginibacter lappiensis]|uniref:histidine kinase n=1 Tax=Mucilaginibacter lappiensis TaxID=354630 RepID=A0ABR6PJU0_9SPHI|nr:ATP-binding protein [Mucilaginibacter lappiensis]MBB6109873.1 signal transduction histidine kinase [Mucilaginibacter lappiensis]SIR18565.1 Histidine kinase-, DNA gyrase B-, and HSP90-like ATPase [Mucilaginibacter lappiensis]